MKLLLFLAALFALEGGFGLYLWANGASFWMISGPVIVQGFGCAAAIVVGLWLVERATNY
jgi:hypothetical protein